MEKLEQYDLIVIGTGFHGISVARTYLEINPTAKVRLYDNGPGPGGVWSSDRLYPGLKTQNFIGQYHYKDYPMIDHDLKHHSHMPAKIVNKYLTSYSDHFGLTERTQFNTNVEIVEQQGHDGWLLTVRSKGTPQKAVQQVFASKLVVAAGLTSEPSLPTFEGQENFNAAFLHAKDYAVRADGLKGCKSVVVFGGGKSAWDVAHSYATIGIQVNWVIRTSGQGPCWMAPTILTPFKLVGEELTNTRILTWFSPCAWGEADGYKMVRRFLNNTRLGRRITRTLHKTMQGSIEAHNRYDDHPDTKKLHPWRDIFWSGSNRGALNYEGDVFQMIRDGKIKVHIGDITGLSDHTVHLSDSTSIATDAIICSTGWKHNLSMKFLRNNQDITAELGLPHHSDTFPEPLVKKVDEEILSRWPYLKDQPAKTYKLITDKGVQKLKPTLPSTLKPLNVPYRLYRFMVPASHIQDRNIAFAGIVRTGSTSQICQAQSLWITAYFGGKLPHLNRSGEEFDREIEYETMLHSRFGFWRYPAGFGRCFPDFLLDAMPYIDMCLGELGVKFRRKSNFLSEIFSSYSPDDYETIIDEWTAKEQAQEQSRLSKSYKSSALSLDSGWPKNLQLFWDTRSDFQRGVTGMLANVAGLLVLLSIFTSVVMALA